jgi:hypothetical protein
VSWCSQLRESSLILKSQALLAEHLKKKYNVNRERYSLLTEMRRMKNNKTNKEKTIAFRVDNETFKELERISKALGAGTANGYVREIVQTITSSGGASDIWRLDEEKK